MKDRPPSRTYNFHHTQLSAAHTKYRYPYKLFKIKLIICTLPIHHWIQCFILLYVTTLCTLVIIIQQKFHLMYLPRISYQNKLAKNLRKKSSELYTCIIRISNRPTNTVTDTRRSNTVLNRSADVLKYRIIRANKIY